MASTEQMWADLEADQPLTTEQMWQKKEAEQDERGSIRKAVDAVGSAAGSAADWVAGSNVEPEIPKLSDIGVGKLATSESGKAIIMGVLGTSSDDDRIQKAFQEAIPDAQYSKDQFGNLVVTAATSRDEQGRPQTWERFYPNPSGADLATAYNVSSVASLAAPINKLVGGVGYTAAALTGGIEAGLLEAFSSVLANDKYNVLEVPKGLLAGAATKPFVDLGGFVFGKIKDIFTRNKAGDLPTGDVEAEIAQVLTEEGLNPNEVMDDVYRQMNTDISSGAIPAESARFRTAQNLPAPIPMTKGDVSGDKSRQLFEDSVGSGGFGDDAERIYTSTREAQDAAVEKNLTLIQQQMAGPDGQVINTRAGGQTAQQELVDIKAGQGALRDEAYDLARSGDAFIAPDSGNKVVGEILTSLEGKVSTINAPLAFRLFNEELAPLLQEGRSLTDIFSARQVLTKHANQAGPEGFAAAEMNRQLDARLIDQANDMLLYGDPSAVSSWLDAIGKHKDFMKKWETEGVLKKLTSEGIRDGEVVLNVAAEDAANAIFGVALNPNKTNMARDLLTLRKELNTDTWNGLRQEFFIKLSEKMMSTNGKINGAAFTKAWASIKTNKTLVNTLFTKAERANIDALSTTALRISSRAQNYSNSANSLLGGMRRFMDVLGPTPVMKTLGRVPPLSTVKNAIGSGQMYTNPVGKEPSFMKKLLTTTIAVTAGEEAIEGAANTMFGENK